MKTLALVGLIVLGFVVWWPLGAAAVLLWIWAAAHSKETAASRGVAESPDAHLTNELAAENHLLRIQVVRNEAQALNDSVQRAVDESREEEGTKSPRDTGYHIWSIVGDIGHDLDRFTSDANLEECLAARNVLTYLDSHAGAVIALASADPRWKAYQDRELGFEEFREMRGLARVCTAETLNMLTEGTFGALLNRMSTT